MYNPDEVLPCKCFYKRGVIVALQWDRFWREIKLCDKGCAKGYVFIVRKKVPEGYKVWSVVQFDVNYKYHSYTLMDFEELGAAIIYAKAINKIIN